MQLPALKLLSAALTTTLLLTGCGAKNAETASSVLDVPSIDGSIAEFWDQGGPFDQTDIRLALMSDGQVAWFQSNGAGGPVAFVKYVASLGTGIVSNVRAFSAEANLTQADEWQALEYEHHLHPIACSGQEPSYTFVLRRAGNRSTIAAQTGCGALRYNPSLLEGGAEKYLNGVGLEAQNLFDVLKGIRMLGARRT
jgi:hypothetical protein